MYGLDAMERCAVVGDVTHMTSAIWRYLPASGNRRLPAQKPGYHRNPRLGVARRGRRTRFATPGFAAPQVMLLIYWRLMPFDALQFDLRKCDMHRQRCTNAVAQTPADKCTVDCHSRELIRNEILDTARIKILKIGRYRSVASFALASYLLRSTTLAPNSSIRTPWRVVQIDQASGELKT